MLLLMWLYEYPNPMASLRYGLHCDTVSYLRTHSDGVYVFRSVSGYRVLSGWNMAVYSATIRG